MKLVPARKWMVAGSRRGREERRKRERGKGRKDAFAADLYHTEASCPSHQQLLDPETSPWNPAQGAMGGWLLCPLPPLVPPGVRGSLGSA